MAPSSKNERASAASALDGATLGEALTADDVRDVATALAIGSPMPATHAPGALRGRLLASVGRPGRFGRYADRVARLFDWTLDDTARELERIARDDAWGPGLMPGMALIPVRCGPRYAGALASLARFQPGLRFPRHAHPGGEVTLVLDGALRDSSGAVVGRGDELCIADDLDHDFVVLARGECVAAAIAYRGIDLL
jgi:putative transcriptional regulator